MEFLTYCTLKEEVTVDSYSDENCFSSQLDLTHNFSSKVHKNRVVLNQLRYSFMYRTIYGEHLLFQKDHYSYEVRKSSCQCRIHDILPCFYVTIEVTFATMCIFQT